MVPFVLNVIHGTETDYGYLLAFQAVGGVIGSLGDERFDRWVKRLAGFGIANQRQAAEQQLQPAIGGGGGLPDLIGLAVAGRQGRIGGLLDEVLFRCRGDVLNLLALFRQGIGLLPHTDMDWCARRDRDLVGVDLQTPAVFGQPQFVLAGVQLDLPLGRERPLPERRFVIVAATVPS